MIKNTDPVILTTLEQLAKDTQFEADEAREVVQGHTDDRRESRRLEDETNVVFKELERRAIAAKNIVETYMIATGHEKGH